MSFNIKALFEGRREVIKAQPKRSPGRPRKEVEVPPSLGAVLEEKHVDTLVAFTKPHQVLEDQEENEVCAIESSEPMPLEHVLEAGSPSLEGKPVISGLEMPSF
jgi:hypothetical protein